MTKLTIAILSLLALTLTGCGEQTQEQYDAAMASCITEFNYKGHQYIFYRSGCADYSVDGITHDPDCPCREKGGENE